MYSQQLGLTQSDASFQENRKDLERAREGFHVRGTEAGFGDGREPHDKGYRQPLGAKNGPRLMTSDLQLQGIEICP